MATSEKPIFFNPAMRAFTSFSVAGIAVVGVKVLGSSLPRTPSRPIRVGDAELLTVSGGGDARDDPRFVNLSPEG